MLEDLKFCRSTLFTRASLCQTAQQPFIKCITSKEQVRADGGRQGQVWATRVSYGQVGPLGAVGASIGRFGPLWAGLGHYG